MQNNSFDKSTTNGQNHLLAKEPQIHERENGERAMSKRALFLDRDGTLVYPVHYPTRPEQLHLYENLGLHLCTLQAMGFLLVVITNQGGLARGYFSETELATMHAHLRAQLLELKAELAGIYFCPHHPEGEIAELATICECRKPAPGLLLRAAAELDIDLERSWFVGDILDDVEAGRRAGCRTVLVDQGTEQAPNRFLRRPDFVARDTRHALQIIQAFENHESSVDLCYQPPSWRTETKKK